MSLVPRRSPQAGSRLARYAVIGFALLQILTPVLPALGIGEPIGSRSADVRTLITPAGWAFSIWGVLYAGSLVFAIYQALWPQQNDPLLARLRAPVAGAFLGNAVWAAYTQVAGLSAVSVIIIVWTLGCLLVAFRRLQARSGRLTAGERWFVMLPISALAAWLTVATVVNIAASLRFHGVEAGAGAPLVSAAVLLVVGIIAAVALLRSRGSLPYALVVLWALAAIYAAGGQVAGVVAGAAGIAALLALGGLLLGRRRSPAAVRLV